MNIRLIVTERVGSHNETRGEIILDVSSFDYWLRVKGIMKRGPWKWTFSSILNSYELEMEDKGFLVARLQDTRGWPNSGPSPRPPWFSKGIHDSGKVSIFGLPFGTLDWWLP